MAAALVAGFHFTRTTDTVQGLMPFGWVGVEVFFVISGFVIAQSASNTTATGFALGRFLRLYPGAWISAAFSALLLAFVPAWAWKSIQVSVFTTTDAVFNSIALLGIGFTGSYWTLPIELSFYACVFIVVLTGRLHWLRHFAVVLTIYSVPYLVALGLHHLHVIEAPVLYFNLGGWNSTLLRHGPLFALGLFIFAWRNGGLSAREWAAAGLAIALCMIEIAYRAVEQSRFGAFSAPISTRWLIVQAEAVFLLALVAMLASLRWNASFPVRWRSASRTLGLTTYPFYLLHELVGATTMLVLFRLGAGPLAAILGAIASVFAVAYVIATRLEPPFRHLVALAIAAVPRRLAPPRREAEPTNLSAA